MSDQKLFDPAVILPIPGKQNSKTKNNNMREAVKTETKEIPKPISKDIPKEVSIKTSVEIIPTSPIEPTVEKIPPPIIPGPKRLVLTKSKDKTRTSYIIDKKIVQYIDSASRELKYGEIQNHYQATVAEELIKISQYFYEKYRHKLVNTITSGEQISEFVFREFRKEFNIMEDE